MEKQTNNFDILYAYLFCERRPIEAASILHMHRNNVVYRISKIEKMYDLDLNDEVTRLNLFLSFLMYKTM